MRRSPGLKVIMIQKMSEGLITNAKSDKKGFIFLFAMTGQSPD